MTGNGALNQYHNTQKRKSSEKKTFPYKITCLQRHNMYMILQDFKKKKKVFIYLGPKHFSSMVKNAHKFEMMSS